MTDRAGKAYEYFQPDRLGKLRNLNLLARRAVEGFLTGLHKSPHKGFSVEFAEHREYTPGDDLRHLDWVAWGRTDRHFTKLYEQETNLRAYILLDVSGSMGYRHDGEVTKFVYGCFLTACLSYLMCRQQDSVGVVAFDESTRFHLTPASTPAHLDRVFTHLEDLTPGGQTNIAETFHHLADRIAKRGLVIVISDLYAEPAEVLRAFQHFAFRKHQLMVFHLLDPAELELPYRNVHSFVDMETGERMQVDPRTIRDAYMREVKQFIDTYRRQCADRNIEYVPVRTDQPYERMLLNYLARRKQVMRS